MFTLKSLTIPFDHLRPKAFQSDTAFFTERPQTRVPFPGTLLMHPRGWNLFSLKNLWQLKGVHVFFHQLHWICDELHWLSPCVFVMVQPHCSAFLNNSSSQHSAAPQKMLFPCDFLKIYTVASETLKLRWESIWNCGLGKLPFEATITSH